jgi:hypothetical protein
MGFFSQRLSSLPLKETFKYANPGGLLLGSGALIGAGFFLNEVLVYKLSNCGVQEEQDFLRAARVPRRKPDFITNWEAKYKTASK